jgi:serine/threonine protein kinase
LVAIKVQNQDFDSSVIRWESDVLKGLSDVPTVPSFIYFGNQDKRDFLVMDLLGGEDMAGLRNRIRSTHSTGLVALPGAAYLTRQMLSCIKSVHERGYVHRDIKPANFVRVDKNSTQFSTIDFGIAKQVRVFNEQHNCQLIITITSFLLVPRP